MMEFVDSHLIDNVRNYFDASFKELKEEWISGNYGQIIECPSYRTCYTYGQALEALINPTYGDPTEIQEMLDEEIELDKWKNRKNNTKKE